MKTYMLTLACVLVGCASSPTLETMTAEVYTSCVGSCQAAHPRGAAEFIARQQSAYCRPDTCAEQCADTLCSDTLWKPGDACDTCRTAHSYVWSADTCGDSAECRAYFSCQWGCF